MKQLVRGLGVALLAFSVVLGTAAGAYAEDPVAPSPDHGPVTGNTTVSITAPEGVSFVDVIASGSHTFAKGSDGNFYAWGNNAYGQLGDGTKTSRSKPVQVLSPEGVSYLDIATGGSFTIAIGSDGNTYAWGAGDDGQLGDGTRTSSATPIKVSVPSGVTFTHITAGYQHALAMGSDGNAYAWGNNSSGQLGDDSTTTRTSPVKVKAPAGVTFTSVTSGIYEHVLAFGTDGKVYAWGYNKQGALGVGHTTNMKKPTQVKVPAGVTFTSFAGGYFHTIAIATDGSVYTWGGNEYGQLGTGKPRGQKETSPKKVPLPEGAHITEVSAGFYHSMAISSDGNNLAWGMGGYGQIGDNANTNKFDPVSIQMPSNIDFTSPTAGNSHSVALGSDGNVYAWGNNDSGQLGNGSKTRANTPTKANAFAPAEVTGVAFGGIPGTGLVKNNDGTWSVTTPAHAAGTVDVVVSWTRDGAAQEPIIHAGAFTYEEVPTVPTVTDPGDEMVLEGGSAVFTVAVSGFPEPAVSWEVSSDAGGSWNPIGSDSAAVVSADGLTVTVAGQLDHDGYLYRAVATNSEGTATSDAALLRVSQAPVAPSITNPEPQSVTEGADAVFEVYATGFPEPTVSWEVSRAAGSWEPVSTDDAATVTNDGLTLTIATTLTHDGYRYRALAVNSEGEAVSDPALLRVAPYVEAPTITTPNSQGVFEQDAAVFTVTTTGVPVPEVGWEVSPDQGATWNPISTDSAATLTDENRTLTIAATLAHDGYQYRATAVNTAGDAVSGAATLSVWRAPVAPTVTNPTDQSVSEGKDASFTVTATGYPAPVVSWEVSRDHGDTWEPVSTDRAAILSDDTFTLIVAGVLDHDGYQYRAIATNDQGIDSSDPATLTVKKKSDDVVPPDGSTPADGSKLPRTGSGTNAPLLGGALGALLLGATLVAVRRARKVRGEA